jgi:hypothetical protein
LRASSARSMLQTWRALFDNQIEFRLFIPGQSFCMVHHCMQTNLAWRAL